MRKKLAGYNLIYDFIQMIQMYEICSFLIMVVGEDMTDLNSKWNGNILPPSRLISPFISCPIPLNCCCHFHVWLPFSPSIPQNWQLCFPILKEKCDKRTAAIFMFLRKLKGIWRRGTQVA